MRFIKSGILLARAASLFAVGACNPAKVAFTFNIARAQDPLPA
jgi:hypothetical protein